MREVLDPPNTTTPPTAPTRTSQTILLNPCTSLSLASPVPVAFRPACPFAAGPCTDRGVALSDGGAITLSDHRDDLDCTWRLLCPSTRRPLLNFTHFGTEKGYDFLTVFDGDRAAAQLSGYNSPSEVPPPLLADSAKGVRVQFTSDAGAAGENFGVAAVFSCVPGPHSFS